MHGGIVMNQMIARITAIILLSLSISHAELNTLPAQIDEDNYYIWTRDDMRMCPSPECGGFFVKALNRIWTLCADGSKAEDCHALQLDFSLLGMSEKDEIVFQQAFTDGLALIKGKLFQYQQNGFSISTLRIHEAWFSQAGKETRKKGYFRVHDTGIQCFTTPCLSVEEGLINLPGNRVIAGVDLSLSGADTDRINAGYLEMKTKFVIATGQHKKVSGPAGFSQILVADEFYLPVAKLESCGNTICPAGQTCCNSSCGICVPAGGACIQIACD